MSPGPDSPREGGFVAFHRRMLSSPELLDFRHEQLWVFVVIISLANWRPGSFTLGGRTVDVGRGQLAHSVETIAKVARVSVKTARTTIEKLISRGQMSGTDLGTRSGRRVRVLTIVNYSKYQDVAETSGRRSGTDIGTDPTKGTSRTRKPLAQNAKLQDPFPSDTRAGGRVIKLNPDDVLSDWDHQQQRHVPRGLTLRARERLGRGR
jgi:hypothetical protein